MYGHGAAPPSRGQGTVIALRVLFAVCGFLSCGLLSFLPLFRIAFLSRRSFDWTLGALSVPLAVTGFAVVGALPTSDYRGDIALIVLICLGIASSVYFLVFDLRHHQRRRPDPSMPGPYVPPVPPSAQQTVPQHPAYGYQPPAAPQPAPTPVPQPQPQPHRIDQVRAELDELSDYLRKDRKEPGP
ncbi:hypothetical protein ACFYW6_35545 [Streptomyces sp. NPDC002659]|uniref:hypothetical protein n=1 Tax=Streptomyces sp. NPDC002659 TaxID=3364656 RepID=UPI0036BFA3BE